MRSVRIADDVYAALQAMAVPFEDDINDVLRRLVQLADQRNGDRPYHGSAMPSGQPEFAAVDDTRFDGDSVGRIVVHRRTDSNGEHLPQSTYRNAVLGLLKSTNGNGVEAAELSRNIERQLADRMTEHDLEVMASGVTRWQSQVRNALTQLEYEGTIERVNDCTYRHRDTAAHRR
jgi:hypothetical protein